MATFTINGNLITDEAAAIQNSVTDNDAGVGAGPDNEVAWSTLLATMSQTLKDELNALSLLPATGETAGDTTATFPQAAVRTIGSTSSDFIQLTATTITDLQFSDSSGNAIAAGTATQIFATHNGAQIFLYADASNNIVYGREGTFNGSTWVANSSGTVAFAIVMDDTTNGTNVTGGNVWTIQYEALKHPNTSGIDDADTSSLAGLVDVKASFTTTTTANFGDFSHVPSGQDAWAAFEQTGTAGADTNDPDMIVTGLAPGSTVNVSTTGLGNSSQSIGAGGGVRVDIVNHVNYPDFPLTNTDVHDLSKINYTSHVGAATEASFSLTQVNPGTPGTTVKVHIFAYNETSNLQGTSLVSTGSVGSTGLAGTDQTLVPILGNTIKVYSDLTKTNLVTSGITITAAGDGSYFINGLQVNYTVDFQVAEASHMDRFVVTNAQPTSGSGSNVSFDAGNFSFNLSNTTSGTEHSAVGSKLLFEDDGPSAAIGLATGSVTHDESSGAQTANGATDSATAIAALAPNAAGGVSNASTDYQTDDPTGSIYATSAAAVVQSNNSSFGADGAGSKAYSLSVAAGGVDSGLTTTDGTKIFLFKQGDVVVGRIGADAATAANGLAAFAVAIDSSGFVSVAQYASLHHGSADNPDTSEAVSIANAALQAVVTVTD
ncbi:hypothetical protein DPM33_35385, partial [Mesorhizobium hawassense]